jgi:hypothetical protein
VVEGRAHRGQRGAAQPRVMRQVFAADTLKTLAQKKCRISQPGILVGAKDNARGEYVFKSSVKPLRAIHQDGPD